jgi:hypothetical protein
MFGSPVRGFRLAAVPVMVALEACPILTSFYHRDLSALYTRQHPQTFVFAVPTVYWKSVIGIL